MMLVSPEEHDSDVRNLIFWRLDVKSAVRSQGSPKVHSNVRMPANDRIKLKVFIELEKVDFIFIDGGHEYNTVKNDLIHSHKLLKNKGTILCDDLNLSQALGVRQAIKEFSDENKLKYEIIHERFAKFDFN